MRILALTLLYLCLMAQALSDSKRDYCVIATTIRFGNSTKAGAFPFSKTQAQNQTSTNHILVIDRTKSMIGERGVDIWDEVKLAIIEYINSLNKNDKVTIYSYAETLSQPTTFNLRGANSKKRIRDFINNLEIDGSYTCTYKALDKVVKTIRRGESDVIFLYTDGLNNCKGISMATIAETFQAKRDDDDYIYYISLGSEPPVEVVDAAEKTNGVTASKKQPANLSPVPKVISLQTKRLTFDFSKHQSESLQPLTFTVSEDIERSSNINIRLLGISESAIQLITPTISLNGQTATVGIRIDKEAYFKSDLKGMITLSLLNSNTLFRSQPIEVQIITPKKRKSKITINN